MGAIGSGVAEMSVFEWVHGGEERGGAWLMGSSKCPREGGRRGIGRGVVGCGMQEAGKSEGLSVALRRPSEGAARCHCPVLQHGESRGLAAIAERIKDAMKTF